MKFSETQQYADMQERLKRVDLRSPYYALAAADLRSLDEAYKATDALLELSAVETANLREQVEELEAVNTTLQMTAASNQATIATLTDRVAELEAIIAGTPPPVEPPVQP